MGGRKGSGRCPPTGAASVNIPRCGVRLVAGGTAWGDERERRHGSGGRFWFSASVVILRVFTFSLCCSFVCSIRRGVLFSLHLAADRLHLLCGLQLLLCVLLALWFWYLCLLSKAILFACILLDTDDVEYGSFLPPCYSCCCFVCMYNRPVCR
jgi:hypothetical protein